MADRYEDVMQEVEKRASALVQKGQALSPREVYSHVFKSDPALYARYREAAQEERLPARVGKRAVDTDASPATLVLKSAQTLCPEDPMGRGITLVQRLQPELWRTYQQDYA
jgi:hypothetical protein